MRILFLALFFISLNAQAKILRVMSYNVENLFDTKHDMANKKDKKDWTFIPKNTPGKKEACSLEKNKRHKKECLASDWTEAKLELKLGQISEVVKGNKEYVLPDFLGLVEVENGNVVGRLAKKLGYDHFEITESPDERGIDVALLYKNTKEIKKIKMLEHNVPVDYPTRNILEVEFLINHKYPLTLFVNHWPSLANPDSWRIKAAEVLWNRSNEIMKKNPKMSILALGDFNTNDDNNPHPFKSILFKAHFFTDINQTQFSGTYYFSPKDQWNFLDHFFANKLLIDGKDLEIVPQSFEVYSPLFLTKEIKKKIYEGEQVNYKMVRVPKRFNPKGSTKEKMGYSDHFPILVNLNYPD